MRFDVSQQLRLEQSMKLAPRIIQAMEILQLPILALQERIDAELERNPVLELRDEGVDDQAPPDREEESPDRGEQALVVQENSGQGEDFQRLSDFQDEYQEDAFAEAAPRAPRGDAQERDKKLDAMANTPAPQQSLQDYLEQQWRFVEAPPEIKAAGNVIIAAVDDEGYIRTPLEELAAAGEPPLPVQRLLEALPLVQTLEPPGVAARDLSECLALQLNAEAQAHRDVSLELELVRHFLRDIEMNRLPQIARRTGKSLEQITAAIGNLSHLNPRPGSLIGAKSAPVITPDAIVELDEAGNVVVIMPEGNLPHLHISRLYRKMIKDKSADRAARTFLRNNVRSAQWLIEAIAQRQNTVRRVIEEVFTVQREFLTSGPEALKPLPMADVAGKVGVHVTTVSRAVAGKYVQTPQGIFPLRMFFSGGTTTAEGQDVSWDAVKVKLKELIDAEDKAKPLNDDELAAAMQKHGIKIARRTIAKYRDLLNIPPARQRIKY